MPPQNLLPPVFLRVPCYQLRYFSFIFLTCCTLHTPTHLTLYAFDTPLLSQSWWPDTTSCRLSNAVSILLICFTTWKLTLNTHKTVTILFSKRFSTLPDPFQIQDTFVPWASAVHYLGLMLYSKLLFTWHLHTVANRAAGVFWNIFSLLVWDTAFSHSPIS